ncbi:hypothetical protein TNCV_4460661 [Trichonephila clavipes]|nr:hypothetical protein TNCV_4460661 [Trichonephila clavipes]
MERSKTRYLSSNFQEFDHYISGTLDGLVSPDFGLMDVNVKSHRAHLFNEFLEREGSILWMDRPVRYPDLLLI